MSHCNRQPENQLGDPQWQPGVGIVQRRGPTSHSLSSSLTSPADTPISLGRECLSGTWRTKEGLLVSPNGVMGSNACTGT